MKSGAREKQELEDYEDLFRIYFTKHKTILQVILAPKNWVMLFPRKELGRCITCHLFDYTILWLKLEISCSKGFTCAQPPGFWFRLTIKPYFWRAQAHFT
jgi:hypothetical protein